MSRETVIAPGISYRWPENGAAPSSDSFLLADFALARINGRVCDLCSGAGLAAMLLAGKKTETEFVCADADGSAIKCCLENASRAGWEGRIKAVVCDAARWRESFSPESFRSVICNPPYFPAGSGKTSEARGTARSESSCGLPEICAAAGGLLQPGGRFFICMRASRLAGLMCAMRLAGTEPKRLRFAAHSEGKAPFLVLCEGIKGASPSLDVMPELRLFDRNGRPTEESDRIYYGKREEDRG